MLHCEGHSQTDENIYEGHFFCERQMKIFLLELSPPTGKMMVPDMERANKCDIN